MRKRSIVLALALSSTSGFALEYIGPIKTACEIYRGFQDYEFGRTMYYFDSRTIPEIDASSVKAKFVLSESSKLKESILNNDNFGKRLCFTYIDPISPLRLNTIKTISPYNSQ